MQLAVFMRMVFRASVGSFASTRDDFLARMAMSATESICSTAMFIPSTLPLQFILRNIRLCIHYTFPGLSYNPPEACLTGSTVPLFTCHAFPLVVRYRATRYFRER